MSESAIEETPEPVTDEAGEAEAEDGDEESNEDE